MTTSFFSAIYPDTNTLSDFALGNAYRYLLNRVSLDSDHPVFKCGYSKGDFVEALAVVVLEMDYRWENGGKETFNKLVKRTFG